jgi:hypothetical protein
LDERGFRKIPSERLFGIEVNVDAGNDLHACCSKAGARATTSAEEIYDGDTLWLGGPLSQRAPAG